MNYIRTQPGRQAATERAGGNAIVVVKVDANKAQKFVAVVGSG